MVMKLLKQHKAKSLRKQGKSIKEIAHLLHVAQSSVSIWVKNVRLSSGQKALLKQNQFHSSVVERRSNTRKQKALLVRQSVVNTAKDEFKINSANILAILGAGLYWAEGGKTQRNLVRFSNGDPRMIKLMMGFFRKICGVSESKFRAHIHMPFSLNHLVAEEYWSSISGIPLTQFFKTYRKPDQFKLNPRETLPYGTFDIYICDTKLFLTIQGWIEKIVLAFND